MSYFHHLLLANVGERLGWTLLHSLWQFTAIGVLLWGVLAFLRRRSASLRYLVSSGAILTMLVASTMTFVLQNVSCETNRPVASSLTASSLPQVTEVSPPAKAISQTPFPAVESPTIILTGRTETQPRLESPAISTSFYDGLTEILEPWLPWISTMWLFGVAMLSLRNFGGWIGVLRLRRTSNQPVAQEIADRARTLINRMKISRPVRIVQSALVEVPLVVGWLKPMILLPLSILGELSPEQLEAILAHELAHIRRNDYLINLVQTILETLFFYHPAMWWISRQIRMEREHCCDDRAVKVCGSGIELGEALTLLAAARLHFQPAMAASGGSLVTRVRRVLTPQPEGPDRHYAWLGGLLLAGIVLAGAMALSSMAGESSSQVEIAFWSVIVAEDTALEIAEQKALSPEVLGHGLKTEGNHLLQVLRQADRNPASVMPLDKIRWSMQNMHSLTIADSKIFYVPESGPDRRTYNISAGGAAGCRTFAGKESAKIEVKDGSISVSLSITGPNFNQRFHTKQSKFPTITERLPAGRALVLFVPMEGEAKEKYYTLLVAQAVNLPRDSIEEVHATLDIKRWIAGGPDAVLTAIRAARQWETRLGAKKEPSPTAAMQYASTDGLKVNVVAVGQPDRWAYHWWTAEGVPQIGDPLWQKNAANAVLAMILEVEKPTGHIDYALRMPDGHEEVNRGLSVFSGASGKNYVIVYIWGNDAEADRKIRERLELNKWIDLAVRHGVGEWTEIALIHEGQEIEADKGRFELKEVRGTVKKTSDFPGFTLIDGNYDYDPAFEITIAAVDAKGNRTYLDNSGSSGEKPIRYDRHWYVQIRADKADIDHFVILKRPRVEHVFEKIAVYPQVLPDSAITSDERENSQKDENSDPDGIQIHRVTMKDTSLAIPTAADGTKPQSGEKLDLDREKNLRWGEPMDGLRTRLTAPQGTEYRKGKLLTLQVEIQNMSDKPIAFSTIKCPYVSLRSEDSGDQHWFGTPGPALGVSPWQGRKDSFAPGAILHWEIPMTMLRFRQIAADTRITLRAEGPMQQEIPGKLPLNLRSNPLELLFKDGFPSALEADDLPDKWSKSQMFFYQNIPGLFGREEKCSLQIDGEGYAILVVTRSPNAKPLLPEGRTETKLSQQRLDQLAKVLREQQAWKLAQFQTMANSDEPEISVCVASGPASMIGQFSQRVIQGQPAIAAIEREAKSLMADVAAAAKNPAGKIPPLPEAASAANADSRRDTRISLTSDIKPQGGEKLDMDMEKNLRWGEPADGLRAAIAIRTVPGELKPADRPELYLVVQNVSDAPLHFSDTTAATTLRELYIKLDGKIEAGIVDKVSTQTDVVLQPREVAFLLIFTPDAKKPDGRTTGSVLAEDAIKDRHQTLIAKIQIEKAPVGIWSGNLVTGEVSGAAAEGKPQPKGKEAQSLFQKWLEDARLNGKIPGGALSSLARVAGNFVKFNPSDERAPKLAELLKRIDTSHDWTQEEAVALLNEVTAIYPSLPEWAVDEFRFSDTPGGAVQAGQRLPANLENAPWGQPSPDGLRVAWLLEPRAEEHRLGTPLKSRILFHNTGKNTVVFPVLTWYQSSAHKARDAKDAEIKIDSTSWTTIPIIFACRLAPGEYREVSAAGIGVGAMGNSEDWQNTRTGSWVEANEGDEVTFTPAPLVLTGKRNDPRSDAESDWWLNFIKDRLSLDKPLPDVEGERKHLLDLVVRDLFGTTPTPEEIATFIADRDANAFDSLAKRLAQRAGFSPFIGTLQSGTTQFRVLAADLDAAKKPRIAKNPGHYTLRKGVVLAVSRRPDGERLVNEASIQFSLHDPILPASSEPYQLKLPDGYDSWAAAWVRGETVLWLQDKSGVHSYDFSNPAKVKEEVIETDKVPVEILEALRGALSMPSPPATSNTKSAVPPSAP